METSVLTSVTNTCQPILLPDSLFFHCNRRQWFIIGLVAFIVIEVGYSKILRVGIGRGCHIGHSEIFLPGAITCLELFAAGTLSQLQTRWCPDSNALRNSSRISNNMSTNIHNMRARIRIKNQLGFNPLFNKNKKSKQIISNTRANLRS